MKKVLFIIMAALCMVGCNDKSGMSGGTQIRVVNPSEWNRRIEVKSMSTNKVVINEYVMQNSEKCFSIDPGRYAIFIAGNFDYVGFMGPNYRFPVRDTINVAKNQTYKILIDEDIYGD